MVVDYGILNLKERNEFEIANNAYLSRMALFPLVLFYLFIGLGNGLPIIDELRLPLAAVGLAVLLIAFAAMALEWTAVTFTEIPAFGVNPDGSRAAIRVIQNRDHDFILEAFSRHWRERMRALHFHIDGNNNPQWEEARLRGLLDNGIISADEYRNVLGALHTDTQTTWTH